MNAKGTVMNKERYRQVKHTGFQPYYNFGLPYLEEQAEISFAAGKEQGYKKGFKAGTRESEEQAEISFLAGEELGYEEGFEEGIRKAEIRSSQLESPQDKE